MHTRNFLLGALVLLLLAFGLAWRVLPSARPPAPSAPPAAHAGLDETPSPVLAERPEAPARTAVRAPDPAPLWTPSAEDLVGAHWVAGRVVLPEGTPTDDRLVLEARGKPFRGGGRHSVQLGPAGAFHLAFSKDTKRATLHLSSRFLSLDDPALTLPFDGQPFELRPELGGVLQGRIELTSIAEPRRAELAGTRVRAWSETWANSPTRKGGSPELKLDEDGRFEFDALPAFPDWTLRLAAGAFSDASLEGIEVRPGQVGEVQIATQLLANVRGLVVDEAGAPVEGARFEYGSRDLDQPKSFRPKQASTKDGTFALTGVPLGAGQLRCSHEGFLTTSVALDDLREAQIVTDLRVTLPRGSSLAGQVRWPDGQPAALAQVSAWFLDGQESSRGATRNPARSASAKTDSAGHFVIAGIPSSGVRLLAFAQPREESATPPTASNPTGNDARRWSALLELDEPGSAALELVLSAPGSLRGRVIDTNAAPVTKFQVRARPLWRVRLGSWSDELSLDRTFDSADGSFQIDGLLPTTYEVRASTADTAASTPRRVDRASAREPIEIVLATPAAVSGVVLDAFGNGVAAASVELNDSERTRSCVTDAAGRFEFETVAPGSVGLHAKARGWAPSNELRCTLSPGERRLGASLQLRKAGRIVGEVRDAAGNPDEGRPIELGSGTKTSSDALGRFTFEDLAPGWYSLHTLPKLAELRGAPSGSTRRREETDPNPRSAGVRVEEGATASVKLGGVVVGAEPIQIAGRVTSAGQPVPHGSVRAWRQGADVPPGGWTATCDAEGRFRLRVAGAGQYLFTVVGEDQRAWRASLEQGVPEGPECEVVLEIPGGCIAGRVVDHEGHPVVGVTLWIGLENKWGYVDRDRSTESGALGSFRFEHLTAGTYTITSSARRSPARSSNYGETTRGGYVVREGATLDSVRFELAPACRVEGSVRLPSGAPASGATIFVRDGTGRVLDEAYHADATGEFVLNDFAPGLYNFLAQSGRCASSETVQLALNAEHPTRVDLALQEGTILTVQTLDAGGQPSPRRIAVLDARGNDLSAMRTWDIDTGTTSTPPGRRFGPLAPGTYTLRCTFPDVPDLEQEVRLAGEPVSSVTLQPR